MRRLSLVGIGDMSAGVLAVHSTKHTAEAFCAAAVSIAIGRVYHGEVKRLVRQRTHIFQAVNI